MGWVRDEGVKERDGLGDERVKELKLVAAAGGRGSEGSWLKGLERWVRSEEREVG